MPHDDPYSLLDCQRMSETLVRRWYEQGHTAHIAEWALTDLARQIADALDHAAHWRERRDGLLAGLDKSASSD